MKILSYGSLNLDYVYTVDHFVQEGETQSSLSFEVFCGGKGLNQSIAMSRAGLKVFHAGSVGKDTGQILIDTLTDAGVCTRLVSKLDVASGHAMIQRDRQGKNGILIYGGANQAQTKQQIDQVLSEFNPGDYLVIQNEINHLPYIVEQAAKKGIKIVLNPSPMDGKILELDLSLISIFMVNEIEATQLANAQGKKLHNSGEWTELKIEESMLALASIFPEATIVMTLGAKGSAAVKSGDQEVSRQAAYLGEVLDTTAAGDCFTGYFLAALIAGETINECLNIASIASSIAVSRVGAAPSIPFKHEVEAKLGREF